MSVLDVFQADPFTLIGMTNAINKIPFVPGRASQLLPWTEQGIPTIDVAIESQQGLLTIVNPTPYGGPGETIKKEGRVLRVLRVPHYQRDDAIMAIEVQGVREFGQEQSVQTVQGVVNRRMAVHTRDLDFTMEYQRVSALKGIILNPNGSTLYNLFTEFGETANAEVDFNLDQAPPATGALRAKCAAVVRLIADNMGGTPFNGVHAFCSNTFFDALLAHPEVVQSYLGYDMARVLREPYVYPGQNEGQKIYGVFEFGGIVWENYRGTMNGNPIIEADKCYIFPMAIEGFFNTVYSPADYMETVNTIGRPRYAKQFPMPNDKGVAMEIQSNALSYVNRPSALVKGKLT